jgi:hypothetical protein
VVPFDEWCRMFRALWGPVRDRRLQRLFCVLMRARVSARGRSTRSGKQAGLPDRESLVLAGLISGAPAAWDWLLTSEASTLRRELTPLLRRIPHEGPALDLLRELVDEAISRKPLRRLVRADLPGAFVRQVRAAGKRLQRSRAERPFALLPGLTAPGSADDPLLDLDHLAAEVGGLIRKSWLSLDARKRSILWRIDVRRLPGARVAREEGCSPPRISEIVNAARAKLLARIDANLKEHGLGGLRPGADVCEILASAPGIGAPRYRRPP